KANLWRMIHRPKTSWTEAKGLVHVTRSHLRNGNAWLFRDCLSIVPARQQLRDTARSHFLPEELLHVVPNGIDTEAFAAMDPSLARAALSLPAGPIIVSVGRLSSDKGFDVAITAFARIAADRPDARLLIVGDGEDRSSLEALVGRLGLNGRVEFRG